MNVAIIIENRFDVTNIIERHMKFLSGWGVKHLKEDVKSQMDYNYLLVSEPFWDRLIAFERVLIFQHDSEILREGVDEFLEWDMIGAPLWFQEFGCNGGLSIRNPRVMKQICSMLPYKHDYGNEDVYFSNVMHNKYNLAPKEECEKFAAETKFRLGTFGAHDIDRYLTKEQCEQIRTQYIRQPENSDITA